MATHELVRANGLPAAYIRPIAFYGYGSLGVHTRGNPVETVIMSWPWGAYLGEESLSKGITAKISSWTRVGPNVIPHVSKATGIYLNSMLATTEALEATTRASSSPIRASSPTGRVRTSSSSRTAAS